MESSSRRRNISRREALKVGATTAMAAMLAACTSPAPPTQAPKPVDAPKPAGEQPKPAAAAPATKPPVAAAKPTAAAKPAGEKPGRNLIGTLEGPDIVTDPAQWPKTFKEAPKLAEMVKSGTLPPVAERVPQDPLVVKPVHEIGIYGGDWRRGFSGPGDKWNGYRAASGPDHVLFWDYTGDKVVPNIAKGYRLEDGGRVTIIELRRGMKWSDGQPFTADDFVFWHDDLYLNKDLVPTPSATMMINGKPGKLEKVDQYTVRYVFPDPYTLLPDVLAGSTPLASHSHNGLNGMGSFAPAHYLKQFLPKYIGEEAATKKAKDANFENWVLYVKFLNDWALNPELPVVTPWKTVTPINNPQWILERNPYSIWVDTDGNQLPYIDRVVFSLAENLEVINLRAIAGEYDFQARHLDIGKLPVFLENQEKGQYKMHLDTGDYGGDMIIKFNMSYELDAEIAKWFNNVDFRRALSLGIDRDQLNEAFWLGVGTPGSVVPADSNKYNPGPEYRKLWSTYEPQKANELLDKIGLDKKDSDGYRLRTDGKGRLRIELMTYGGQFVQYTLIGEAIREQWREIGVDMIVQEVERSLGEKRQQANESQMFAWLNDGSEHMFTFPDHIFAYATSSGHGALFGQWFQSAGKQGKEPPPKMKEAMEKFRLAFGTSEDERIQLGKDIWKLAADEVWSIGVVGLSPAAMGIRVAKTALGNVPSRQYNSPDGKTPGISRPTTFFWRK